MPARPIRLRVVVGLLEGEDRPFVAGAAEEDMYEIIPPEEWDRFVSEMKRRSIADWGSYDWREVVVTVPLEPVMAHLRAAVIEGEVSDVR
jgi:hypothetical protein